MEKALGLYLDGASLAKNYELLRDKLLSKSGSFITNVVQEGEPRLGKDGLMSLTTQGGGEREGAAEVAEPDVARRAHRVHPQERRPEGGGAK